MYGDGYDDEGFYDWPPEVQPAPTDAELCAAAGHGYYGDEADCEGGRLHRPGEACQCGRCYCGERRYAHGGGSVVA